MCEHGAAGHHIALDWRVEWAAGKVRTRVLAKARSSDLEEATATIAIVVQHVYSMHAKQLWPQRAL